MLENNIFENKKLDPDLNKNASATWLNNSQLTDKKYKIHILTILLSIWVLLLSYSSHSGCIDIYVGPLLE